VTPADLARVRELFDAWQKGTARGGDLAELQKLLPQIFEVAAQVVAHSECPSCSDMGVCVADGEDDE
jgi:hypothetical protein